MNKLTRGFLLVLAVLLLVTSLSFGAYWGYHHYKVSRYNNLGDNALEEGNWTLARFWYNKVLEVKPDNLEALSKLCQNGITYRDPDTLVWLDKIVKADPESNGAKMEFANALLKANRVKQAKAILDDVVPNENEKTKHLNLLTAYHAAIGDLDAAEKSARESLELFPESNELKLNLVGILLKKGDLSKGKEINQMINELSTDSSNQRAVWRMLLAYSLGRKNANEALPIAKLLSEHPEANWYEKAAYLRLLVGLNDAEIPAYLKTLTSAEPLLIEEVCRILNNCGRTTDILEWLDLLSENGNDESNLSYQISKADALSILSKWDDLLQYLEDQNWEFLDYYRNALLSRAMQENGDSVAASKIWNNALKQARESGFQEEMRLANLVKSWGTFEPQWLQMLDEMMNNSVHTLWAHEQLTNFYYPKGATYELLLIGRKALQKYPDQLMIKNNAIIQSLLLGYEMEAQLESAKEIYLKYEGKPIPTSTYAFALYKNGQLEEAYNMMMSLDPKYFDIAELAHYAAVICKGVGKEDECLKYMAKAKEASLLPEEAALLEE